MTRILSAIVLLPIVVAGILWLPFWGTLLLAGVILVPAVLELTRLLDQGHEPLPRFLMIVAAGVALLSVGIDWFPTELAVLAALVASGAFLVGEARPDRDVARRIGAMLLPVIYLGLPLGAMVAIRRDHGGIALLLLLATTVVSDTAQYYGGRLTGRRPLAPRISPKKTREGAAFGVLIGGLVLPLAAATTFPNASFALLWGAGIALVGFGIVGDLFESLLKRSVNVKDSSGIIPGHGGVLDRVDSLLFAAPVYYGFLRLFV